MVSWWLIPRSWQIPFVSDGFVEMFGVVAFGIAVVLALRQTVGRLPSATRNCSCSIALSAVGRVLRDKVVR